jgi:hypothetical protein
MADIPPKPVTQFLRCHSGTPVASLQVELNNPTHLEKCQRKLTVRNSYFALAIQLVIFIEVFLWPPASAMLQRYIWGVNQS